MKKIIKLSGLLMFLITAAHGQKGYFVQKDHRILKYENDIITFLIEKKQFSNLSKPLSEYKGSIFVEKKLEIYLDNENAILLIQFGSLADHVDKYWGLLTNKRGLIFYDSKDPQFLRIEKLYDSKVARLISLYIEDKQ